MANLKKSTPTKKRKVEKMISDYKAFPADQDRTHALAPILLQNELNLSEPIGVRFTREDLEGFLNDTNWNNLVCYMGLDDTDPTQFRHVAYFYNVDSAGNWNQVTIGGGGGGGVTANSVPPPNSPPPLE